jgi:hypothetical protein
VPVDARTEVAAGDIRSGEALQGAYHHYRRGIGRIFETTLKPGVSVATMARDLGYLNQIKDAFGPDRWLTDIGQAEVAKWRDELVTNFGLIPNSFALGGRKEIAFLSIEVCIKLLDAPSIIPVSAWDDPRSLRPFLVHRHGSARHVAEQDRGRVPSSLGKSCGDLKVTREQFRPPRRRRGLRRSITAQRRPSQLIEKVT